MRVQAKRSKKKINSKLSVFYLPETLLHIKKKKTEMGKII